MKFEALTADWRNHHIEGYAAAAHEAGKPSHFEASLISHIEGNLYVGGCVNGVDVGDSFAAIVSLYPWERYTFAEGTNLIETRMYDDGGEPNADVVWGLASTVVSELSRGKTLVHCQAGLNRSNLVAGAALILMGRSAEEAIALLREKRTPLVLCNQTFERWLLSQAVL